MPAVTARMVNRSHQLTTAEDGSAKRSLSAKPRGYAPNPGDRAPRRLCCALRAWPSALPAERRQTLARCPVALRPSACALRLQTTVCGLRPERRAWRAVSRRPAHQQPTSPSHSLSSSPLPYRNRCGDKRPRSRATRQPLRVCHVLLQPQGTMRASRGCPGEPWARNSANGKAKRAPFDICCNGEPDDEPGSESSAQVGVKPLEVLR